jgi:hypothetical protein
MADALQMATSVALRACPPSSCIPRSQATGQRKCTAGHIASRCICICYATLLSCPLMFTHCSVDRWPTPLRSSASPMSPPGLRARQPHVPAHNRDDGDATVRRPFAGRPRSHSIASGMSVTIQLQPAYVQPSSRGSRRTMATESPSSSSRPLYLGLRRTMTTESPRRNILLTNRSLFTGCDAFLPLPVFGICTHGRRACSAV